MRFHPILTVVLAAALFGCAGCGLLQGSAGDEENDAESSAMGGTPRRGESPSFTGPGSAGVQRGKMPGIDFPDASWEVADGERAKVKAVAAYLKMSAERVVLAGGAVVSNSEYARQLGQQRALSVRNALIREGIPANKIITVSYGSDLPGRSGDRVEFGFVPTGETDRPER